MTPVDPPSGSADLGVPWHFGDPHAEQRRLARGEGAVDLSNRGIVTVTGPDRLTWLDDLTTQRVSGLHARDSALTLVLSPHGHVEHELHVVDDGTTTWLVVQPGTAEAAAEYLRSMQFMLRVDVADRSADFGVVWEPLWSTDPELPTWLVPADFAGHGHVDSGSDRGGDAARYVPLRPGVLVGREVVVPRDDVAARVAGAGPPAGTWALEALRAAAAVPRLGQETDHKTLPHEVGWVGPGVHLSKGCYRGQEAVARVHNLGHPPRRLVLLHLDGSANLLPSHGDAVMLDGRAVGWVATPARHYELGPIATAVVRRNVSVDAPLVVTTTDGDIAAGQETVVVP